MKRVLPLRHTAAAAVAAAAALGVGVSCALIAPASAATHASPRGLSGVPSITLDFTGLLGAVDETGKANVKDDSGNTVGTAVQQCSGALSGSVYCSGIISYTSGGQISYAVFFPTAPPAEGAVVKGVVNGGAGQFEGVSGEIIIGNRSHTVEDASFD